MSLNRFPDKIQFVLPPYANLYKFTLYQNARSSSAKLLFYIITRILTQQTSAVTVQCPAKNIIAIVIVMTARKWRNLAHCKAAFLWSYTPCASMLQAASWLTGSVTDKENVSEKLNEFRRQRYPREISLCQEER